MRRVEASPSHALFSAWTTRTGGTPNLDGLRAGKRWHVHCKLTGELVSFTPGRRCCHAPLGSFAVSSASRARRDVCGVGGLRGAGGRRRGGGPPHGEAPPPADRADVRRRDR